MFCVVYVCIFRAKESLARKDTRTMKHKTESGGRHFFARLPLLIDEIRIHSDARKKRWHVLQSIALFFNIGNWGEEPSFAPIYDSNELGWERYVFKSMQRSTNLNDSREYYLSKENRYVHKGAFKEPLHYDLLS